LKRHRRLTGGAFFHSGNHLLAPFLAFDQRFVVYFGRQRRTALVKHQVNETTREFLQRFVTDKLFPTTQ
jgi:hypothetical protein